MIISESSQQWMAAKIVEMSRDVARRACDRAVQQGHAEVTQEDIEWAWGGFLVLAGALAMAEGDVRAAAEELRETADRFEQSRGDGA
jgi:hypothetical protein